jgi:hypothetical protein
MESSTEDEQVLADTVSRHLTQAIETRDSSFIREGSSWLGRGQAIFRAALLRYEVVWEFRFPKGHARHQLLRFSATAMEDPMFYVVAQEGAEVEPGLWTCRTVWRVIGGRHTMLRRPWREVLELRSASPDLRRCGSCWELADEADAFVRGSR